MGKGDTHKLDRALKPQLCEPEPLPLAGLCDALSRALSSLLHRLLLSLHPHLDLAPEVHASEDGSRVEDGLGQPCVGKPVDRLAGVLLPAGLAGDV